MKHWKTTFYALGLTPVLFSVSLLTFYFHAGLILGKLPRYNQPDPKELDIYNYYQPVINITGNIWIISFLFWVILAIIYLIVMRRQAVWKPILISVLAQLCVVFLFLSGIIEWFAD